MSFNYSETRKERTNWRDQELSNRHRQWGFNCPAIDIDFLMVEYNSGSPVALIDYKRYTGTINNVNPKSFNAITVIANNSYIPFFVVYYWDKIWAFRVEPVNDIAKKAIERESNKTDFSEREFVTFLYRLRNININPQEQNILSKLNNDMPPQQK